MSESWKLDSDTTLPKHVEDAVLSIGKTEGLNEITLNISSGSVKGDNYMGKILKVDMSGIKDGTSKPIPLIVKISPFEMDGVNMMYNKEIISYETVLPTLYSLQVPYLAEKDRFHFAKYYSGSDENTKEFVILEDLCTSGYKIYNRKKSLDLDHLTLVMKTMARIHATSFVLQRKDHALFRKIQELIVNEIDYSVLSDEVLEKSRENLLAAIEDPICKEKLSHFANDIKKRYPLYLKPELTSPYNVIAHGDCWNGNFIFKYEEGKVCDLKILDWQTIRISSPIIDIAYMMFTCTDEEIRKQHYHEMLELYYDTLEMNINKMGYQISECYPKSTFQDHIKLLMSFGLVTAMSVLPMILSDEDPVDYNEEDGDAAWFLVPFSDLFIERINGVVRDFVKYNYT